MPLQNSVRSYLGISKEVTKGTLVAPSAFIPVAANKLKATTVIDSLFDEGLRGSVTTNYNWVGGRTYSNVEFGGPLFADTFAWSVAGIMGTDTTTGAGPYVHALTLKYAAAANADAQPTSFTLTDFYGITTRAYAGCQISDLTLNFAADGLLEYDAKAVGFAGATTTLPTPTFSALPPVPVWKATVTIGGTAVAYTTEGSISLSRSTNPIFGISNTQNPYQVFVGPLEVKGQLKFAMESDTELSRFLAQTSANLPSIVIAWTDGATVISATLTKGAYTTAVIDRGKDYVEVSVDIVGIANTTDAGTGGSAPIKWSITNAVIGNTYQ